MEEITTTIDNGESEVQLATLGTVYGSDKDGNPVEQHFTENAFAEIEKNSTGKEFLVDQDHKSMRPALERDSTAMGFVSDIKLKKGKGLFGRIKWTDIGRKLIENRVFRFLSPVFRLKTDKTPESLVNVALTNMPSLADIAPIVNSAPIEILENTTMEENKSEEIKEEIKEEIVEEAKEPVNEESEKKEEVKEEIKEVAEAKPITKDEIIAIVKEVLAEVKNAEPEKKEACNACDENEVISKEALNSASDTKSVALAAVEQSEWKNLHGKEFFDYLKKNGIR